MNPRVSRRAMIGASGASVAAAGLGFGSGFLTARGDEPAPVQSPAPRVVPFYGAQQAGITTPAQSQMHFAAFDVVTDDVQELTRLLKEWTAASALMTAGQPVEGAGSRSYYAPPSDTGEAQDLGAENLTVTFGFGPSLFTKDGKDRFGIAARRPASLVELPHFPGDTIDKARSDGDLVVQACAEDPQVAVHAIRNLARIGFGIVAMRWSQLGFGRTSSTSTTQATPRNLFGFKDGTANIKAEQPKDLAAHVWVGSDTPGPESWMSGGTYLVARRIRMQIETWDRSSLREQETIIGRNKAVGAPLSGGQEQSAPNFELKGRGAEPLIAHDAHVRMVHPSANKGIKMLRRGYNYTDGSDGLGRIDAGLFFIAFVIDPRTHYIPIQTTIARGDALSEYLRHTGSGLWAIPPGARKGGYIGQGLFEA